MANIWATTPALSRNITTVTLTKIIYKILIQDTAIYKQKRWGEGEGGGRTYDAEKRLVKLMYLIVHLRISLLSVSLSSGCP